MVRELRGLGVSVERREVGDGFGGGFGGGLGDGHREYSTQQQYAPQQHQQEMYWPPLPLLHMAGYGQDMGYGGVFGQQQGCQHGYGQEGGQGHWGGYGHDQPRQEWFGRGHGRGQVGTWSEVDVGHDDGCCGYGEDSGFVDGPRDSASESMACECGTTVGGTTVNGEAATEAETSEVSAELDSSKETDGVVATSGTRARTFSLPLNSTENMTQNPVEVDDAHDQHDGTQDEQGENTEKKNSTRERAGSWSDAEAVISEELRGAWREKMSV